MSTTFDTLQEKMGMRFASDALLRAALTHPSRDRQQGDKKPSDYERLEFLGDRVLSLVIAEWLYEHYPQAREGELAKRHAALVNRDILADIAAALELDKAIILVNPEDLKRGRVNILSDALEALIGAAYLDAGRTVTRLRSFIEHFWQSYATAPLFPPQDAKSALQEWAQSRGLPLPEYKVIAQRGPAHAPHYTIEVYVKGEAPEQAEGASKREAEKRSAEILMKRLQGGA